jgi:hypothetical protein
MLLNELMCAGVCVCGCAGVFGSQRGHCWFRLLLKLPVLTTLQPLQPVPVRRRVLWVCAGHGVVIVGVGCF